MLHEPVTVHSTPLLWLPPPKGGPTYEGDQDYLPWSAPGLQVMAEGSQNQWPRGSWTDWVCVFMDARVSCGGNCKGPFNVLVRPLICCWTRRWRKWWETASSLIRASWIQLLQLSWRYGITSSLLNCGKKYLINIPLCLSLESKSSYNICTEINI